jgi:cytidylate kinase
MPLSSVNLRQIVGSLRTNTAPAAASQAFLPHWPFVTISREAGSGAKNIGTLLAQRLNVHAPSEHPWQALDRELVERIAADHHISEELVASLEKSSHTWIADFFHGLAHTDKMPSQIAVFKRVVETVHALARAGHVILIGLGSSFMTRDIQGGLHVRLVGPFDARAANLARHENISLDEARKRVEVLDHERLAYFHRFWPQQQIRPDLFHVVFNVGYLKDEEIVAAIETLIKARRLQG